MRGSPRFYDMQSACRAAAHEANLGKPVTDENNNNRLDTDFIGYPIEGYALSNGIRAVILSASKLPPVGSVLRACALE